MTLPQVRIFETAGPGFAQFFSTDNEMMVALRTNVFRIESTGNFDAPLWTTAHVGSGTANHTAGELLVETGATANSVGKITSVQKNRQMSGTTQMYINVVRLNNVGVANNNRRWGMYDDDNGFFFELNGTTFNIVTRKAAIDSPIEYSKWNGPVRADNLWVPGHLTRMNQYGLFFGGMSARFHINGAVAHRFGANTLLAPLTEVLSLPFRYESINSGGLATNQQIFGRGTSFHRVSPSNVAPRFKRINASGVTVVKSGPGTLRSVVFNNPLNAANTTTIYDNTAAAGDVIAAIVKPVLDTSPFQLDYNLEVSTGITVDTTTAVDITVVFD